MATELQRELYRTLREAQDKYTYFLLAAAGAAIGLAVSQTQGASPRKTAYDFTEPSGRCPRHPGEGPA